jgi:hypothetical protein
MQRWREASHDVVSEAHRRFLESVLTVVPVGSDVLEIANAVLLHLEQDDLPRVLVKLAGAAPLIAFTLKVGEGSEWSTAKTGLPRFFQYWSETGVRAVLAETPWQVEQFWQRQGLRDERLQLICRRA